MDLVEKYKLSTYKEISVIEENSSKKICVVMDEVTNKLYVKKVLCGTEHFNFYVRLSSLEHKNLIKIHDVICYDNSTHVLEEYVSGQTLQALLETEGIVQENKAKNYIMQICDALIYLHNLNPPVIYRDIKPENIMLNTDHVIKLIDFDIAREFKQSAQRDTMFMGTKEYAAPEQYGYKQTDGRTDIYAIGVLLHELLTGKLPQNNAVYKGPLHKIISKCLQLEPKHRYQSVYTLKKALAATRFNLYKKIGIYTLSAIFAAVILIASLFKFFGQLNRAAAFFSQAILETESDDSNVLEEKDTITLTSEGGHFTVKIPSDWKEDPTLNEAADLQAARERTSSYFVLLSDAKNDLDCNFEEWKEIVLSNFTDMDDLKVSEEVNVTIDGNPAAQQTVSGINEGTRVKLLITYINGQTYFGQILCASTESTFESSLSSFETIIHSVRGL